MPVHFTASVEKMSEWWFPIEVGLMHPEVDLWGIFGITRELSEASFDAVGSLVEVFSGTYAGGAEFFTDHILTCPSIFTWLVSCFLVGSP